MNKTKVLKTKLNTLMADSMLHGDKWKSFNMSKKELKLFKNLKAKKLDNRSGNYKKLYSSLIPFLKEANPYDKLQKMILDNNFITGSKTIFHLAVYLIGQEFGISINQPSHFGSFIIDGEKDQKIKHCH